MKNKRILRIVSGIALLVAGTLLCLNTLFAYRYSTDWNLGVVLPSLIGLFFYLYAIKLFFLKAPIIKNKRLRTAVISLFIICCLAFVTVETLIIIDPYVHRSELAGRVDTVIVLGCGVWPDGRPTLSLASRLDKAITYFNDNTHVNIIVSGGQGPSEPFSEALAMEAYLLERGIPADKIIKEDKSTSTRENFEFSRVLMGIPENQSKRIIFVTNDFHILRSRILARRFGFDAYAISAPTPGVIVFNSYLREFFAFVKSMVLDY